MFNPTTLKACQKIKEEKGYASFGWVPELKVWGFNLEDVKDVYIALKGVDKITLPDKIIEDFKRAEAEKAAEIERAKLAKITELDIDLPLRGYQKIGTNFIVETPKCFINDEQRLGKSLQAIAAFYHLGLKNILIICPNNVKTNWSREVWKWINRESFIYDGWFADGVNIINYERLIQWLDDEGKLFGDIITRPWDMIIVDESHKIKNKKSKRTKAVLQLCKVAPRVVLMTGTPVLNKPVELATQLRAIDKMEVFGSEWKFLNRYCRGESNGYGYNFDGAQNLAELQGKMQPFALRRLRTEVLTDLPRKNVFTTTLDFVDAKVYYKLERSLQEGIAEMKEKHAKMYHSLRGKSEEERAEIIAAYKMSQDFTSTTSYAMVEIEKLKQEAARQKVVASQDVFEEYIENKTKAVVFCAHKDIVRKLHEMYPQSVMLTGDTKQEDRQALMDDFNNDPELLFFICTMQAAGMGIDLSGANDCIFIEFLWTPADHAQCEDRIFDVEKVKNAKASGIDIQLNCNYLVMEDTIDMDIIQVLHSKSETIEQITTGDLMSKLLDKFIEKEKEAA